MKKSRKILVILLCLLLFGSLILNVNHYGKRPLMRTYISTVVEEDGELWAISTEGYYTRICQDEFSLDDSVFTIVYYNPDNNIHDDIIRVESYKVN